MATQQPHGGRWHNYHLTRGEALARFWPDHLAERPRDLLLVTSRGLDPRTTLSSQMLRAAKGQGRRDVLTLIYREGDQEREGDPAGVAAMAELADGQGEVNVRVVNMYSEDGRRVASQWAAEVIGDLQYLAPYDDIVIDVSGMPRGIYFPLIARVLFLLDHERPPSNTRNVFVLVAENAALDASIKPRGWRNSPA